MSKVINAFLILIVFGGLGWWFFNSTKPEELSPEEAGKRATFVYYCEDSGESIKATFHIPEDDSVDIELSDGRSMNLPQAVSASGARYANKDESFVFWNKGQTAFIYEDGNITFANCHIQE